MDHLPWFRQAVSRLRVRSRVRERFDDGGGYGLVAEQLTFPDASSIEPVERDATAWQAAAFPSEPDSVPQPEERF